MHIEMLMTAGGPTGTILYPINLLYRPFASATLTNTAISSGYANTDSPNAFMNYVGAGALFKAYRVISHGIKLSTMGVANAGGIGAKIACCPSPDGVGFGSYYSCAQASNSKRLQPSGICTVYNPESLKGSWTIASVAGRNPRAVMDEDDFQATGTAGPANVMYNTIQIETTNQVNATGAIYMDIDLFWTVQLENPNVVGSSD